ncbi:MAG: winged helix-turn-helix transcriptional regulator [Chlorobiales bacterium]|jgi:DNA-binding MarR family transcriptional regulator|nr:winged helix-turn-helix transcriptional regulator [Chlorobiales bacterium]
MKLEDDIQQKQFHSVYQKLSVNVIYTFHWLSKQFEAAIKSSGITSQQYNILRILRGQHPTPCTVLLLRERMLDKQSDASRLVQRLLAKGLVKSSDCPNDRRRTNVLITEKGLTLLKELDNKTERVINSLNTLSPEEASQLSDLLDKLRG